MQRIITIAAILLVVQIGLAAFVLTRGTGKHEAFVPEGSFLSFDPQQVTSLTLSNGEGSTLSVQKNGDSWVAASAGDAPVDATQVEELLQRLAAEKQGLAVATTASAAPRFHVAPDAFSSHLVLAGDSGVLADFYVGTGAGYQRSHARRSDSDDIVIIGVGEFELDPTLDNWLDKNVLKRDRDQVARMVFPDFTLTRQDQGWVLESASPGETVPDKRIENLLDSVCGLSLQTLISPAEAVPLFEQRPVLEYHVETRDGTRTTYTFAALADDDSAFALRLSDQPFYFKIYGWLVKDLQSFTRERLTAPAEEGPAAESLGEAGAAPQQ